MEASSEANANAAADAPPRLSPLLPPGDPATVAEIVEGFGLWDRAPSSSARPRVLLNMIASVDGRATLSGRSGPLSDAADRKLFHGLRTAVDAVLVGAGTLRTERYGRLIAEQARRDLRRDRGLEQEPLACVVSASLALGADIPLFEEPAARVAIITPSDASLPEETPAHVDYVRATRDGRLDLAAALVELRERFGVRSVLCEGGPHLARDLIGEGLVDEVFLSLSPTLAGG
ncbi:MAG TPA: dihydrofolate reductase family protein, partial [Solirubrobacteraceae bacterium]|nr:dihydrofolate reductase family protein [Solirubrobacteraceae bacterium]